MNTYKLIKDVLEAKKFKKEEMTAKIKSSWIKGDITEAEQEELLSMLPAYINAEAERPETIILIKTLSAKIEELTERVEKLECGEDTDTNTGTETTYEKWTAWDGISKKYQFGAIVEHLGVIYESTFDGQNVWEPGTPGTEALWKVYDGASTT